MKPKRGVNAAAFMNDSEFYVSQYIPRHFLYRVLRACSIRRFTRPFCHWTAILVIALRGMAARCLPVLLCYEHCPHRLEYDCSSLVLPPHPRLLYAFGYTLSAIIELTMSLPFSFSAFTAFFRETDACVMTRSISLASRPSSSTSSSSSSSSSAFLSSTALPFP